MAAAQVKIEGARCRSRGAASARWDEVAGLDDIWEYAARLPEAERQTMVTEGIAEEITLAKRRANDLELCDGTQASDFETSDIWQRHQAEVRKMLPGQLGALLRIPGAHAVVSGSEAIPLWPDLVTIRLSARIDSAVWSPDGKAIAVMLEGGRGMAMMDAQTGQTLWTLSGQLDSYRQNDILFSRDGAFVYVSGESGRTAAPESVARKLSARDGSEVQRFVTAKPDRGVARARTIAVDEERHRLLAVPEMPYPSNRLMAFDLQNPASSVMLELPVSQEKGPPRKFFHMHLAVDGGRDRLWWSHGGMVAQIRLSDAKLLREFQAFNVNANVVSVNPANGELAVGGGGETEDVNIEPRIGAAPVLKHFEDDSATAVRIFDGTGRAPRIYSGAGGGVEDLAFSPDGKLLAAARGQHLMPDGKRIANASLVIWDVASGKMLASRSYNSIMVSGVAFDPKGERLAVTVDQKVHIFRIPH
jgi:dipeptidyl aminopeptidase/acylaminoacyl peptidase